MVKPIVKNHNHIFFDKAIILLYLNIIIKPINIPDSGSRLSAVQAVFAQKGFQIPNFTSSEPESLYIDLSQCTLFRLEAVL
jgi:hypothetical protein